MRRLRIILMCYFLTFFSLNGSALEGQNKRLKIIEDSIIFYFMRIDTSSLSPECSEPYYTYVHNKEAVLSGASCQGFFISKNLYLFYKILELYDHEFKLNESFLYDTTRQAYLWDLFGYYCENGNVMQKPKKFLLKNKDMVIQLYLSYKAWIAILEDKGLKYVRSKSISPLFNTNISLCDSSSLFRGIHPVSW